MKLRNIAIPSAVVQIDAEQSLTVRGITAEQAFLLYHKHRDEMAMVFERLSGNSTGGSELLDSVAGIIAAFPLLVGEVIALATGSSPLDMSPADPNMPDGITGWQADLAGAMGLPLPIQVEALMQIGSLTFTPEMPPKKFFGLLVAMIQQATEQLATSTSGSDS